MSPSLIIHGGAGVREGNHARFDEYGVRLCSVLEQSYAVLAETNARQAVIHAVRLLEDDPLFNAGTGSRLQGDGEIRMSAALMLGGEQSFSGVINISGVEHPIDVADMLSGERHAVLAGEQATLYAHANGFAAYDPVTEYRRGEFERRIGGKSGTVGAVALDGHGKICAATSTGGVGFETPGRVSDSATVAGTYASDRVGVSCTGAGEDIGTPGDPGAGWHVAR